jgi:hypothetical protein
MEEIHTPRGHNCYMISGFLICDDEDNDDDDDDNYHHHH